MHRLLLVGVAIVCGLAFATATLRADGPTGCAAVTMSVSDELPVAWRQAADGVRAQLAELEPSECIASSLRLVMNDGAVDVVATRPDGTRAQRRVARPGSLLPIVMGLVVSVPEPSAIDADSSSADGAALEIPDIIAPPDVAMDAAPVQDVLAGVAAESPVLLDVSLNVGARLVEPTRVATLETELRIDVIVRRWLVFAGLRYAPIGESIEGLNVAYEEFALALGVGRRLSLGRLAFDAAFAPVIAFSSIDDDQVSGAGTQLRLAAQTRLVVSLGRSIGLGLMLDGELVPNRLAKPYRPDPGLPPLPSWTLGSRLGVVGTLP